MPEGHGEDFAAAWAKHIALLEPLRVLTPADAFALEGLVCAYLDLRRAQADIATYGSVFMAGELLKSNPACAMAANADRRYRSWLQSFGLTPADRERVSRTPEAMPVSEWAEFADR